MVVSQAIGDPHNGGFDDSRLVMDKNGFVIIRAIGTVYSKLVMASL